MFMSKEEALCVYVLTGLLIAGSIALLWVNRPIRPTVEVADMASSEERGASAPAAAGRGGDCVAQRPSEGTGSPAAGPAGAAKESDRVDEIVVHVSGAVKDPGVHRIKKGDRVVDAVNAAGGPSAEAFMDAINLAAKLEDGQRVHVPTKREAQAASTGQAGGQPWQPGAPARVNINTAGREQLEALPGIGPGLASAIIDYRQRNGGFRTVEDLMKVGGIGQKTFARLKPLVTVN